MSILQFSSEEKSRTVTEDKNLTLIPHVKTAQFSLSYSINETGNMNDNKSNVSNPLLEAKTAETLEHEFNFKNVHSEPTKYRAIVSPHEFIDDYHIKLKVEEINVKSETVPQAILRFLSLGFRPQKVEKMMTYTLEIEDRLNKKKHLFSSQVEKVYSYKVPLLYIPVNLDHHPFSIEPQLQQHLEEIKNLLRIAMRK